MEIEIPELEPFLSSLGVVPNAYENCHAKGVFSIVLKRDPIVRVFIAGPEHDLWKNVWPKKFSVGFHPHHCNLSITGLRNRISNLTVSPVVFGPGPDLWREYEFASHISGLGGRFVDTGHVKAISYSSTSIERGQLVDMESKVYHTIFVERHEQAAWLIREGVEDPGYKPLCYSNADLSAWSSDGLYKPMLAGSVRAWLSWATGGPWGDNTLAAGRGPRFGV